ncbi:hypothetical protein [Kitasatospora sp. NPDC093558]|uniref:hypothetical protein n=1 Tax=Kitasatospora sp. NPDC093558 TaxID=3155201 RepID=UPI0034257F70
MPRGRNPDILRPFPQAFHPPLYDQAKADRQDAALIGDRLYAWQDHAVELAPLRAS